MLMNLIVTLYNIIKLWDGYNEELFVIEQIMLGEKG
jgi:hypothetical protein